VSQRIWHGVYGLCCGALCGGVIMLMMPQHFGLSLVSVPIPVMGLALAVIGFCSGIHFVEYVYATGTFLAALVVLLVVWLAQPPDRPGQTWCPAPMHIEHV
jgi:hypothetical protein